MAFLDSGHKRRWVLLLAVVAGMLRAAYIWRHYDPLNGDGRMYHCCAMDLLGKDQPQWADACSFTGVDISYNHLNGHASRDNWKEGCSGHPLGFAALLAGEYALFGPHPSIGLIFNLLITLSGIWISGLLAMELAGERAGWIALVIGVIYYDSIRYGEVLLADHAFDCLLAAGVLFLTRSEKKEKKSDWILGTILLGLSSWFRAITGALVLGLPAVIWIQGRGRWQAVKKAAFAAALFFLTLLPIIIVNSINQGHLVNVAMGGGFVFWASNHPQSKGDWNPQAIPWRDPHFLAMPQWQRDKAYYREGWKTLARQPLSMIAKRELFKIFGMFYPFLPEYDYSLGFCMPFFLLALLSPLWSEKKSKSQWAFIGIVIANAFFVTLLFNGYPRGRLPLNWIIVAVSAVGVENAWEFVGARPWIGAWGVLNLALWAFAEPLRLWIKAALGY